MSPFVRTRTTRTVRYGELVRDMLNAYQRQRVHMSLKIRILDFLLDSFAENLGAVSDEHGERFHQDIADMEHRYQGEWHRGMLADYCWTIVRDSANLNHNRNALKTNF
jgi:hypothetical protein